MSHRSRDLLELLKIFMIQLVQKRLHNGPYEYPILGPAVEERPLTI